MTSQKLEPSAIRAVVAALEQNPDAGIATLTAGTANDQRDPNAVKAIVDGRGCALYLLVPRRCGCDAGSPVPQCWRHVGIYAYRREVLLQLAALPRVNLSSVRSLSSCARA